MRGLRAVTWPLLATTAACTGAEIGGTPTPTPEPSAVTTPGEAECDGDDPHAPGSTSASSDPPGPAADGCGDEAAGHAVLVEVPTSWDPADTPGNLDGYEAGEGVSRFWFVLDVAHEPDGALRYCGSELPAVRKVRVLSQDYEGWILAEATGETYERATSISTIAPEPVGAPVAGEAIAIPSLTVVVGVAMDDPAGEAWPEDWTGSAALRDRIEDPDDDGALGLSALPRLADGFVPPPTTVGSATQADPLHHDNARSLGFVQRFEIALEGLADTCGAAAGTAHLLQFDAQVVSCRQRDDDDCSLGEARFVDEHTPIFRFDPGSFATVPLAVVSCAGARAAAFDGR